MNTDNQETINNLNVIRRELNRYIPIPFLILGTIGNVLNILVFTRPLIRTNSCSIYFISGSIVNWASLCIGLITPFLGLYNLDPTQKYDALCKIRYYLRYSTITLSTWCILLACIDRLLSTSNNVNIRSWSSLRLAKRIIISASMICFIFPYTQVFYCFGLNPKTGCSPQNSTCKLLSDIILFLCNSGLPHILMIMLSILTIRNVKYSNHIVANRRRDVELTRLLFIQVCFLCLFGIPMAAQKIYSVSTNYMVKSPLAVTIDNLIYQIAIELSYVSNSTIFYIYSLTSKKYRKEVFRIVSLLLKRCQNIKIHPALTVDPSR